MTEEVELSNPIHEAPRDPDGLRARFIAQYGRVPNEMLAEWAEFIGQFAKTRVRGDDEQALAQKYSRWLSVGGATISGMKGGRNPQGRERHIGGYNVAG